MALLAGCGQRLFNSVLTGMSRLMDCIVSASRRRFSYPPAVKELTSTSPLRTLVVPQIFASRSRMLTLTACLRSTTITCLLNLVQMTKLLSTWTCTLLLGPQTLTLALGGRFLPRWWSCTLQGGRDDKGSQCLLYL